MLTMSAAGLTHRLCVVTRAILAWLAILTVVYVMPPIFAQARIIELGDLQKIVNVSSPAISPDGKSIVIIVSRVNWDEDRYDSQLLLVDIATGAQRPLMNIRPGLTSPQWSPSGDRLAFLAEAGEGNNAAEQIFVLPMNGGEPQQILLHLWASSSMPGVPTVPSWRSTLRTNQPSRRRSRSITTYSRWATTAASIQLQRPGNSGNHAALSLRTA